jgi:hypothetical protein
MNQTLWRPATQNEELLDLLRYKGDRGVTPMEALEEVGTMRLAARIHDLRAAGHRIRSETVPVKARNGRLAHVTRYQLVEP